MRDPDNVTGMCNMVLGYVVHLPDMVPTTKKVNCRVPIMDHGWDNVGRLWGRPFLGMEQVLDLWMMKMNEGGNFSRHLGRMSINGKCICQLARNVV